MAFCMAAGKSGCNVLCLWKTDGTNIPGRRKLPSQAKTIRGTFP